MSRKKLKFQPEKFESIGKRNGKNDTYAGIYRSMLFHPAFTTLKHRQKILYVYCKEKYYGHGKPETDYPDVEFLAGKDLFYMSFNDALETGLYTKNMKNEFYNDMKALEEHGFIKTIVNGKANKKKSIYRYSSSWITWTSLNPC